MALIKLKSFYAILFLYGQFYIDEHLNNDITLVVFFKVKKAMFLGASAIIIITLNQRVLKKVTIIMAIMIMII